MLNHWHLCYSLTVLIIKTICCFYMMKSYNLIKIKLKKNSKPKATIFSTFDHCTEFLLAILVSSGFLFLLSIQIKSSMNSDTVHLSLSNVYSHISGMIQSNASQNIYGKDQFLLFPIHHRHFY